MSPLEVGGFAIGALVLLIFFGLPIGIGMLVVSFAGVSLIRGDAVAMRMLGAVANDSLEEYLFAVVPLFVLMGLLVTVSNVGKDTFDVFERLLRRITAGLGIATVFANAIFASITGISTMALLAVSIPAWRASGGPPRRGRERLAAVRGDGLGVGLRGAGRLVHLGLRRQLLDEPA